MFRAAVLFSLLFTAQADETPQPGQIELRVELRQGGHWRPVDVHTVFRNKDELRFTFKSSFPGYLRVVNHSSDGQTSPLFPLADSTKPEQLEANTPYLIPGPKGSFVVAGKPGFDLTEWFLSSSPMDAGWQPPVTPPNTLLPRCDNEEQQLRQRACLDGRAGPGASASSVDDKSSFRSRDLFTLITVPDKSQKLVVYEFRVAHN